MKRRLSIILLTLILIMALLVPLAGCQGKPNQQGEKTIKFVDSAGREVELPQKIERVAPSGALSQIVLFSLAPDKLVGLTGKWTNDAELYIDKKYLELPVLGQFYATGDLNLEVLAAAKPQVIIDIGEKKATTVEDMDKIMNQVGIPTIFIEATTETMPDAYEKLGELLGMKKEAKELSAYCKEIYSETKKTMESIGEDKKAKVLYCLGVSGQNIIAKGSFHGEIIDLLTNNVGVVENVSGKGNGNEVSMEQILQWNPDYIIFAPGSIYATVKDDAVWKNLKAVQNGNYYEVPFGPYNWLGFPPSVNRYMGMIWLSELLYPEQFDYDLFQEAKRHYRLFYHCELTKEMYDALVKNAL